ncbi:LysM peptidoglycan-binding domain-containing protein [Dactylosporangium sp. NPDC050588]|uniref:CIS tube protein n=1 Tax=Dactylosporangium sp. NPDC050588 TaxID=3157211 RepID=UPI0033F21B6B
MTTPVSLSTVHSGHPSAAAPAGLQRAYLELREPAPGGTPGAPGDAVLGVIEFQFNPTELIVTKHTRWRRDPQRDARRSGPPQFTGAEPSRLQVEMFFDATDTMDDRVVAAVERLFECCVPTERSRAGRRGSPPWVLFHWGGTMSFPAYVSSVTARYSLFTPEGTPVRATCAVTLEELSTEAPSGLRRAAPPGERVHVVAAGDTLTSVAFEAYGDPAAWRRIAEASGIDDPLRLTPGTRLVIPGPRGGAP